MDFSTLFYSVFPVLGEFFGKLSALALMPFGNIALVLKSYSSVLPVEVSYTNVFTGVSSVMTLGGSNGFIGLFTPDFLKSLTSFFSNVTAMLWNFVTAGVPSEIPLIFGLLIFIAESFFIIVGIRFIVSMFRGF